jgi:serine/threonine protein kinase
LQRWSLNGTLEWSKVWGESGNEELTKVQAAPDGYIAVGYTRSNTANSDTLMQKWSFNGTLVWTQYWGGGFQKDILHDMRIISDGYIVAGYTATLGSTNDVLLQKWDFNGVLQWLRSWQAPGDDQIYTIELVNDGYVLGGYTSSAPNTALIQKWSLNGTLQWTRVWGGSGQDLIVSLLNTDNGLIAVGYTSSFGAGNYDVLLQKWNLDGTLTCNQQKPISSGSIVSSGGSTNRITWGVVIDTTTSATTKLVNGTVTSPTTLAKKLNNCSPVLNNNTISIREGETITLTPEILYAKDGDNEAVELQMLITALQHVQFTHVDNNFTVTNFTQQDINLGKIQLTHDGGEIPPSYNVTVSDGLVNTSSSAAKVYFFPINDLPEIRNGRFSLEQGQRRYLQSVDFDPIDEETPIADLTYKIHFAENGYFSYSASPEVAINSFGQQSIDNLQIFVTHADLPEKGKGNFSPFRYQIEISDGKNSSNYFFETQLKIRYSRLEDPHDETLIVKQGEPLNFKPFVLLPPYDIQYFGLKFQLNIQKVSGQAEGQLLGTLTSLNDANRIGEYNAEQNQWIIRNQTVDVINPIIQQMQWQLPKTLTQTTTLTINIDDGGRSAQRETATRTHVIKIRSQAAPHKKSPDTGAIAGGVIGGLVGVGLIGAAGFWACCKYQEKNKRLRAVSTISNSDVGLLESRRNTQNLVDENPSNAIKLKEQTYYAKILPNTAGLSNRQSKSANHRVLTLDNRLNISLINEVELGRGNFGKVKLAQRLDTEELVAVKKIYDPALFQKEIEEAKHIKSIRGQTDQLPLFFGHVIAKGRKDKKETQQDKLYLVFQHLKQSGEKLREELKAISFEERVNRLQTVSKDLMIGLKKLHESKRYHLDFKPGNFMLAKNSVINQDQPAVKTAVIIDFGCMQAAMDGKIDPRGSNGDWRYFSPQRIDAYRHLFITQFNREIHLGDEPVQRIPENVHSKYQSEKFDGAAEDAWALGLTLLEELIGYNPFVSIGRLNSYAARINLGVPEYFQQILNQVNLQHVDYKNSNSQLIKIIRGLLAVEESERLSLGNALTLLSAQSQSHNQNVENLNR